MTTFRKALPQLGEQIFLTDGGCETTLIFHEGIELPYFACFPLLESEQGLEILTNYYRPYLQTAAQYGSGFVLESATWRANQDWGARMGYDRSALNRINRMAIAHLESLRDAYSSECGPLVISGVIGPRGDGYRVGQRMSVQEAEHYHTPQIETLATTQADLVTAMTLTYCEEAIGIVRAAQKSAIPAVISFTTEVNGDLPDGTSLEQAIATVDAESQGGPAYYMINCAHPDHFKNVLDDQAWVKRIRGVRANASRLSHAELDQAEELDSGNPQEFGELYRQLKQCFPAITVMGGCCGTDHRHIAEVSRTCCNRVHKNVAEPVVYCD